MTESAADAGWKPNEEYLHVLVGMGIPYATAEQALYVTENRSLEEASNYVFDNSDVEEMLASKKSPRQHRRTNKPKSKRDSVLENYKMVFVINMSLRMGAGKIAAQVAHACLGLYRELLEFDNIESQLEDWEEAGEKKIVLKGENEQHLIELKKQSEEQQIHGYLVHDAGRTQVPEHSVTALALFGNELNLDKITGDLCLL